MLSSRIVAAIAVLASGGLLALQCHHVSKPAPAAKAAPVVSIDETLRLAQSLRAPADFPARAIAPHELDPLLALPPDRDDLATASSKPIPVPANTSRASAPGTKKLAPLATRAPKGTPQRPASAPGIRRQPATSAFKKSQSSLSSALGKNYFSRPSFGFSGVVKKTTRGKLVSRSKNAN